MLSFLARSRVGGRFLCRQFSGGGQRVVLGIETSCDDTGIGIVREDGTILADVCVSQTALHVSNGGIIPPVAREAHRSVIDSSVRRALDEANIKPQDLTAVAVTNRPGLPLSLAIGCGYAKKLATKYRLPLIPIHHMQAHALTAMFEHRKSLHFPFVTLLISGGHCLIAYVGGVDDFRLLGTSIDDAPGDILDKTARILKLKNLGDPYSRISGGASVELMARSGDPFSFFERATKHELYSSRRRTCNFSFSGFLTAVQRQVEKLEREENLPPDAILPQASNICASVQYVIAFTLIKRLQRAFEYLDQQNLLPVQEYSTRRLVVSGGCASNKFLTGMLAKFAQQFNIELFVPSPRLCTDNGLMIAWNGILRLLHSPLTVSNDQNATFVLRDKNDIASLDYVSKSPIGIDLTLAVTDANIKCDSLNVNKYVDQIRN